MAASPGGLAQVGEWLKPTDCKSVPPSEVRRFESFPVHQICCTSFECGGNYESLGGGADCVPGFGCPGVCHAERFADPVADAADSGAVCVQELGAAQRCTAPGTRPRIG